MRRPAWRSASGASTRVDEARLPVEDVHGRIGDLAVHLQHHAEFAMRSNTASSRRMSVTPASAWVVAPAG